MIEESRSLPRSVVMSDNNGHERTIYGSAIIAAQTVLLRDQE